MLAKPRDDQGNALVEPAKDADEPIGKNSSRHLVSGCSDLLGKLRVRALVTNQNEALPRRIGRFQRGDVSDCDIPHVYDWQVELRNAGYGAVKQLANELV